ncbi:DUF1684 domain-containing protein [Mucilaginibacter pallidiroseus]|uniref:DUF1684 domain-containing protein n=1 Tax=Mucilaginibacter pallidiroseus TaxID=2599295 RepID=A0A563UHT3_9SPHI|nr:DUF1684 domain-containing protein [Mucilaginibacter pallidiroseus]TWR30960.1 DUF1684 domain-containing protein [Mucilaginibacter pallidiroseus]
MKYLTVLLCFLYISSHAQDYSTQLAQHRRAYKDDFLKEARSPLKEADLPKLRFYDADSTYRVTATVEKLTDQNSFVMPVFSGQGREHIRYAVLKFTLHGRPMQLTVYTNTALASVPQYRDYLFLPFTDTTNGNETYGGGRYIDLREGDIKDGKLTLDFNKAYNPYCAYSAGYSCPKPPAENDLNIAIKAGEKLFAGATH